MTPLINADTILKQPTTPPSEFHANYQVAIVGAGLVGLLLAIVVRQAGYSVIVCDKDSELKEVNPMKHTYPLCLLTSLPHLLRESILLAMLISNIFPPSI